MILGTEKSVYKIALFKKVMSRFRTLYIEIIYGKIRCGGVSGKCDWISHTLFCRSHKLLSMKLKVFIIQLATEIKLVYFCQGKHNIAHFNDSQLLIWSLIYGV